MKMEQVKELTYQGVAPWMLWVTAIVVVVLCAAIATVWKVVQINRDEKKRKQDEMRAIAESVFQEKVSALAEDISQKVTDSMTATMKDKFAEIDRKLDNDKRHIESAERQSAEHEKALERIESTLESVDNNIRDMQRGFTCLARGTIATLNHQRHNGNADELDSATEELNNYLTERPIAPMNNNSNNKNRRNEQ